MDDDAKQADSPLTESFSKEIPSPSDGFRVRCPHCHDTVQLAGDESLKEVECRTCGMRFSLVDDRTLDWQPGDASSPQRPPTIGQFQFTERLGAGSFGTVWKAYDAQLDRTVAIKVPRKGQLSTEEAEQFLREARAAAQLQHPYVVTIHEVGIEDDRVYIISDFIKAVPLNQWMVDQKPTLRESAELCEKISVGLHHAHQSGVVHRDVKPNNILIDFSGNPHIMDFGLAKRESAEVTMTVEGQILGTPAYMSPEQAKGQSHEADRRADIYSLGVVLFELLTGERPFRGNMRMLLKQIIEDDPPSPRMLDGQIPCDLETICLKCLEKEPSKRYLTAQDVSDELRRYIRGEPIRARPIGRFARLWRWCRRNPVVTGLSFAAASLLVLVAVVATAGYLQTSWAYDREAEQLILTRKALSDLTVSESKARESRREAQQLAGELLVERVELMEKDRPLGWTWKGLKDIATAVEGGIGSDNPYELRRLTASCLSGIDLREIDQFARNEVSFCVAFSPNGSHLAIAQHKAQAYAFCKVTLVNLETKDLRILTYTPTLSWQLKTKVQDGGRALAFSPDGRWLLLGTRSGWIHRWDLESDHPKGSCWEAHQAEIYDLVFSPDATALYSASLDKTVARWDVLRQWKEGARSQGGRRMRIALASDGSRLTASDGATHLRDPVTLERSNETQGHAADLLSYCGNSRLLAIGSGTGLHLVDEITQKTVRSLTGEETGPVPHLAPVHMLDVSPDGSLLVSSDSDGQLKLWDVSSGKLMTSVLFAGCEWVRPVFSPDGRYLATPVHRHVVLFELSRSVVHSTAMLQETEIRTFAISDDKKTLASLAGHDGRRGFIRAWDVASGKLFDEWEVDAGFNSEMPASLSFHPASKILVASGGHKQMHVLRRKKPRVTTHLDCEAATGFLCGADGRTIWGIHKGNQVTGWNISSMKETFHWNNEMARVITGQAAIHSLDVGKRWILAGSAAVGVVVLDASCGEAVASWPTPGGSISSVMLTDDESLAVMGTDDGVIRLVRVADGHVQAKLMAQRDRITSLAFGRDGTILAAASREGTVCLWRVSEKECEQLITLDFGGQPVTKVAFNEDASRLFVLVQTDNTVRVWHLDRLRARLADIGLGW